MDDEAGLRVGPPTAGVSALEVDGRLNLFNPHTERAVTLNESATEIWRLCTGEYTATQICRLLGDRFAVTSAVLRDDVLRTIDMFVEEGLLRAGSRGTGEG